MANNTAQRPQQALELRARFAPETFNDEQLTIELVWTTGARVRRSGWPTDYIEELSLAPGHVRLDRLNKGAPLLDSHNSYALADVIGVVESAWIQNGEGRAMVRFSKREEVQPIVKDVQAGIIRSVSVGYKIHKTERDESGGIPVERAVDWEPYELSLVPIPADAGAQVRSEQTTIQGDTMNTQTINNTSEDTSDQQTRAERQRAAGILDYARNLGVSEDLARQLIEDGTPLAEARGQIQDARAAEEARTPCIARVDVTEYGQRQGAPDEMLQRGLGECISGKSPRHAVRVLEDFLIASGRMSRVENLSSKEIVSRAWATSDFPIALQGLGQREVLSAYQSTQNGLIAAATRKPLSDFRPVSGLRFSQLGALPGKKEGGEYKATGFSEEAAYQLTAKEFGTVITITRNAIINDDLGMVGRLLQEAGRAGAETDRELLAGALASITWSASNSTTSSMGIEALGAGVLLLRRQQDAEKRPVSFEPDLIVSAPEHELELRQLLGDYQPASAGEVQPFSNLRLAIDHRLTEGSFFMVDSRYAPLMIGSIGDPAVSTSEDFKTGGLMLRVQHDAAACVVDTRSICKVSISA